ncbi:MAG: hypothetical protein NTZ93_02030 [Candidatus Beckwithbacteria bacterium]|nr:hypothetical protein [Candidatus Beckwithbacteria bacterium]
MNNLNNEKCAYFHYDAKVVLEDRTTKKIGYLVNNRVKANILTLNTDTNSIEPKPILNWIHNSKAEYFIQLYSTKCEGNGRARFACTPEQQILTPNGYKTVGEINVGDSILLLIKEWQPSDIQKEIILGGLLGDGCLRRIGNEKFQYRETHCKEQDDYLLWKSSYFKVKTMGKHKRGGLYLETFLSTTFRQRYIDFYQGTKKHKVPKDIDISPLVLAIWYQDDGSFVDGDRKAIKICTNCFNEPSIEILRTFLKQRYDINTKTTIARDTELIITLGTKETRKFFNICGEYIHPVMRYKVPVEYRSSNFIEPKRVFETKKYLIKESKILTKYIKQRTRTMERFSLETENNNFLVDGIIVK